MRKRWWIIVLLLALSISWVKEALSREFNPAKTVSVDTTNIERRLNEAERAIDEQNQKHKILLEAAEERNKQLQTLLQWLGVGFIVLSVIFAGIAAWASWHQSQQQGQLIGAHVRSAESVSDVLGVVQNILDNRLLTVEEERKEIVELRTQVGGVTQIINRLKAGIEYQRKRFETTAEELALIPRHDFKKAANIQAINAFARDIDNFRVQYPEDEFSGHCLYIRGIAAVLNDNFKEIHDFLKQVITLEGPKADSNLPSRKRLANANYYLGLNHSNLGELDDAIRLLEQAHKRDPEGTDLLTRLVMAETYVMSGQYKKAEGFLQQVEKGLEILKPKQKGELYSHQLRLYSRAYLIRTNMALLEKSGEWKDQAKQFAEMAYNIDPDYYYASFNLGQILQKFWEDKEENQAKRLFSDAYSKIQESGHLHFVKETRIRILLLMVAAICGRYGETVNGRTVNKLLDEARQLRNELPKIDNRMCTVFSPLSKLNENSETIGIHIEEIRKGTVLL